MATMLDSTKLFLSTLESPFPPKFTLYTPVQKYRYRDELSLLSGTGTGTFSKMYRRYRYRYSKSTGGKSTAGIITAGTHPMIIANKLDSGCFSAL